MAVTKKQFMVRLRRMINHVVENHNKLSLYCPASKEVTTPCYKHYNRINKDMCHICNEVMETDICPCGNYKPNKALSLAQEKIKEYFG